ATAIGVVIGVGEILGGVSAPTLAGRAADLHGMQWPMYIMAACAAAGAFFALFLRETAPVKRTARAQLPGGTTCVEAIAPVSSGACQPLPLSSLSMAPGMAPGAGSA